MSRDAFYCNVGFLLGSLSMKIGKTDKDLELEKALRVYTDRIRVRQWIEIARLKDVSNRMASKIMKNSKIDEESIELVEEYERLVNNET